MRCENHFTIRGSIDELMAILAPVERWALLFPHYPWVRFIGRHGQGTVVQMQARRGWLPLAWTAEHIVYPEEYRIVHRHLRGPTTGFSSECRLVASGDTVEITVVHDWQPAWPFIGPRAARLVGHQLAQPLTDRTLRGLVGHVESGRAAALYRLELARRQSSGFRRRHGP